MIIIKRINNNNNNKADQVITIIMTIVQRKTGCYDTNHHQVRKECGTRDVTSLQLGVPKRATGDDDPSGTGSMHNAFPLLA